MRKFEVIIRSLFFNQSNIAQVAESPRYSTFAHMFTFMLGIYYGVINIVVNYSYVSSFEASIFRNFLVPLFFILGGVMMIILTRIGFTLLLWAGAKGVGGPGLLSNIFKVTGIALLPIILAIPPLLSYSQGGNLSTLSIALIIATVIWIFIYFVKAIEVIQKFTLRRAFVAVLLAHIFFGSIFYLTIPV